MSGFVRAGSEWKARFKVWNNLTALEGQGLGSAFFQVRVVIGAKEQSSCL